MAATNGPYYQFGAGYLIVNPTGGNLAPLPTPILLGTIQDASLEITQTLKELRGNLKFPDDVAPGDMKASGKITFGRINVNLFNQIFFADTFNSGLDIVDIQEAAVVPSTPFQVTVVNAASFDVDLGVQYAATRASFAKTLTVASLTLSAVATSVGSTAVYTGTITGGANNAYVGVSFLVGSFVTGGNDGTFLCTASTATTLTLANSGATSETHAGTALAIAIQGQYQVNTTTGVYTFAAADAAAAVQISYSYSSSTGGNTLLVTNDLQGYGPVCELWLDQPYKGNNAVRLFQVRFSKITQPLKRSDYSIIEMDYEAYANASGNVLKWYTSLNS